MRGMDISAHYLSLFLGVEVGLAENRRLTVFPGWEPAKRGMRGRVVAVHTNRRCYHSHSHPNRRIRRRMTPLPRFGCASEGYDDGSWPLGLLFRYSPPPFFSFSSFPSPARFPAKERLCSYAGRVSRLFGWSGAGDSGRGKA